MINSEFGMINDKYFDYFSLEDFVSKIKLSNNVLEHLEYTNKNFDNYMKTLAQYDQDYIVNYFGLLVYQELSFNQKVENKKFDFKSLLNKSILFDTLNISHKRMHELHNFVISEENKDINSYRKKEVNISSFDEKGNEIIFYHGAKEIDLEKFMNDFIKIYKHNGTSLLFSNPFLASSLIHLLFVRIHPYSDGNGRMARVLHNIKFTEMINKLYGTRLKLSPLDLSQSILKNKITYVKRINNIYFDLEHDNNEAINKWFNFMLDMVDERLNVATNLLSRINPSKLNIVPNDSNLASNMRLSRIKK